MSPIGQVVLKEFQVSEPLPIPREDVPMLRKRLGDMVDVLFDVDGVRVRPKSFVGYIPITADMGLTVLPKTLAVGDLVYVLEKARMAPRVWNEPVFAGAEASHASDLSLFYVKMLVHALRYIMRDGFYRPSQLKSVVTYAVKGKVNLRQTLRSTAHSGVFLHLHCDFSEPSLDCCENRFIKYVLRQLLRTSGIPKDTRRELVLLHRSFAGISSVFAASEVDVIREIVFRRIVPSGRHYYIAILSLCLLIFQHSSVVIGDNAPHLVNAFAFDMALAFERYIRAVLAEAIAPDFRVLDGKNERPRLFLDSDRPVITPDILITRENSCVLVADTKYKDKDQPSADDWYQAVSYAVALGVKSSVLIWSIAGARKEPRCFHADGRDLWVFYFRVDDPHADEGLLVEFVRQRLGELTPVIIPLTGEHRVG